ncbi:MAG: helix-turn-helix domain-containing protein [Thermoplasmatota archaeon]
MRKRIAAELQKEISGAGGVRGLSRGLPPRRTLEKAASQHGVLSNPVRLKLLLVLLERKLCVCVLKAVVSCPDTRLSYHLSILKRAGLVSSKRVGSYLYYFITPAGKSVADKLMTGTMRK